MNFCCTQRTNAHPVAFRRRALRWRRLCAALRCGTAWLWLFAFLFAVQAHATHLHVPTMTAHATAMLQASVSADVTPEDGVCVVCSTLVSDCCATQTGVPTRQMASLRSVPMDQGTPVALLLAFDLFCRPPPVRSAAV